MKGQKGRKKDHQINVETLSLAWGNFPDIMGQNRPSLKASLGVGGEEVARGEDVQGKGGWGVMAVASAKRSSRSPGQQLWNL